MKIVEGLESLGAPLDRSVVTIGNFDGVHLAHRRILARARALADQSAGPLIVLTFDPHPLTVVAPEKAPPRLSTRGERLDLLAAAGADVTIIARSEPRLLSLAAEEFIENVVVQLLHPLHIVEGPSFGFGRGRKGTPELLKQLAPQFGFEMHIVDEVSVKLPSGQTVPVSSSLIRRLLREGDVVGAAACLGRGYALHGVVGKGEGRGRRLGFPTANLEGVEQLVPAHGVYAGRARYAAGEFAAAISIGVNPTFAGQAERIEAYLLDHDANLYSQPMSLTFVRRLREQRTFASTEKLAQQLHRDVQAVRNGRSVSGVHPTEAPPA